VRPLRERRVRCEGANRCIADPFTTVILTGHLLIFVTVSSAPRLPSASARVRRRKMIWGRNAAPLEPASIDTIVQWRSASAFGVIPGECSG
jgi:hypothetical protein